jgi:hypothetical protein
LNLSGAMTTRNYCLVSGMSIGIVSPAVIEPPAYGSEPTV